MESGTSICGFVVETMRDAWVRSSRVGKRMLVLGLGREPELLYVDGFGLYRYPHTVALFESHVATMLVSCL